MSAQVAEIKGWFFAFPFPGLGCTHDGNCSWSPPADLVMPKLLCPGIKSISQTWDQVTLWQFRVACTESQILAACNWGAHIDFIGKHPTFLLHGLTLAEVGHPKFWLVGFFFRASSLKKAQSLWPLGWPTPWMCGVTPWPICTALSVSSGPSQTEGIRPRHGLVLLLPARNYFWDDPEAVYIAWRFREWCFSNCVWWTTCVFTSSLLQNKMWAPCIYLACISYHMWLTMQVWQPWAQLFSEICPLIMHLDVTAMSNYRRFPLLPFSFCTFLVTDW